MTEQELIDLDFQRVDITDADSQNGYDYYYYQKEICHGILLHSTDNIEVKDNKWELKSFDIPALLIIDKIHYNDFLQVISNITC